MAQKPTFRNPLLQVRDLRVWLRRDGLETAVVDTVSFSLARGETLAVAGESGCGKTVTALALGRLLPRRLFRQQGEARLEGDDLLALDEKDIVRERGRGLAYVFQDPSTALNPVMQTGAQVAEAARLHGLNQPRAAALEFLRMAGLSDPAQCARSYPHELSGGMQQRVMIAMALACRPRVLVADEPTTALDVTTQAEILRLLIELQARMGMAILLVTHNLVLVANLAQRLLIMYAGEIVESGPVTAVLRHPAHPYTRALIRAAPRLSGPRGLLEGIEGRVPMPGQWPDGCRFHPRCPEVQARCRNERPPWQCLPKGQKVRCHCLKSATW